jgi:hypothetical protein
VSASPRHPLLPSAKPLRVAPPLRRFQIWAKADSASYDPAHAIDGAVVEGVDEIAALHAWAKAERITTRERRGYEAREVETMSRLHTPEEARAEEEMQARQDALADEVDARLDAHQAMEPDEDEGADR